MLAKLSVVSMIGQKDLAVLNTTSFGVGFLIKIVGLKIIDLTMTRTNQKRKATSSVPSKISNGDKKDQTPGNKKSISNGSNYPKVNTQEKNEHAIVRSSFKDTKAEISDFPRGGKASEYSIKNGKERNHRDGIFNDDEGNKSSDEELEELPFKKKRKSVSKSKSLKFAKDADAKFDNFKKDSVELLSIQHLNVGAYLLGRIVQVNSVNLVVSLPYQMDESEKDKNQLPELSSLFRIGQWIRCKVSRLESPVTATSKHWRIHLTLVPDEVNSDIIVTDLSKGMVMSASVESLEDHGYILSIGLDGISGFLHNDDAKKYIDSYNDGNEFIVGQVITVSVIDELDNRRTVKLTADPEIVSKTRISDATVHNICSLLPGNLITAIVTEVCSNGLRVKVMGLLDGVIDFFHGPKILKDSQEFHENFKIGRKVHGRIIYVSFTTEAKRIRLSLSPHVIKLEQTKLDIDREMSIDKAPIGEILENVTVKKVDRRKGVLVEIESININGYVRFSDSENTNDLIPGSAHRARVIGFAAVDNLLLLSTKKSVLEQKYFRFDDCKIINIIDNGILVSLSDNITALAPNTHLSDKIFTHPSQKFKIGTTHKCRVLNTDPPKNHIYVTFRPILINSDLPIFKSFDDIKSGIVTHGIISGIIGQGCIVQFFGGLKAFIPINQCGIESIKNPKDHFRIGQIVKCRITKVVKDKELIMGSFQINDATNCDLSEINLGDVKQIHLNDVLSNLMVLAKNEQKGFINVTKKPLLIEAKMNNKFPGKLDDIKVGDIVCGYVKSVTDYAVFIGFLGGFSSRATRDKLADHFIASPVGIFHVNQSIVGLITHIDKETTKFDISLKPSEISISKSLSFINQGNFIKSYFEELLHVGKNSTRQEDMKVMIGERVKCWKVKVIMVNENNSKKIKGTISEEQANTSSDIKEGDQIEGVILDMDMKGKNIDLGIRHKMKRNKNKNITDSVVSRKELKKLLNEKTLIDAIIEQVKEDYIIVSLPGQSNIIAFAASKTFNNRSSPFMKYQFGQTIKVQITHVPHHHHKKSFKDSAFQKHTLQHRVLVSIIASDQDDKLIISGTKTIDDFVEGQVIKGTVSGVENYGIFIKIDHSIVSGLCHKSKISDDYVKEVSSLFKIGDQVKAKILSIDKEKQKVGFVMRKSYFDSDDDQMDTDENESEEEGSEEGSEDEQMEVDKDLADKSRSMNLHWEIDSYDKNSNNIESEEDDDIIELQIDSNEQNEVAPLSISGSWKWEEDNDSSKKRSNREETSPNHSELELEDEQMSQKKKNKKKSKHLELVDKTGDLMTQKPEVDVDFERLLIGSPNSSYLWMQYMVHQIKLSEIDKAREIGERALKIINFREQQERLNIWIALMNLENNYGSDETMAKILTRALQACDQKKIYTILIEIYEKSNKLELVESTYNTMIKKFSQSSKVWIKMGLYYIQNGKIEGARALLQRSLKILPKRKHVKTITKFAQMEFKHGEVERGRTIFEGMMNNDPKRIDLWSIYIDMEIKAKDYNAVRRLFQRVISLKFSSKKMKFLFKKWLQFEIEHGNEEQVEEVKEKAKVFAETMS
ncbi:2114_t:CDS:10 [Funneliformis geosporum]|uniref:Protein RRP5 homolog n=1 Tax=Funneliformis geosporum TaxID=1117311 RepID=A0A9W4SI11_9GLOM|nr:2114_t:CDS:10 [Funneliformis geosporum]